jgi:predicted RNase H-like nuclease (RuvC/YqgF family)
MTEEIIVDGVNVAGCKFLEEAVRYNNNAVCSCTDVRDCEGDLFIECCGEKPNCYYKQLKRLEQENKDFEILAKSLYKRIEELEKENESLAFRERLYKADYEASEQENKELKELKCKFK